ncbi:MAG: VOC family protein [Dehalococcoidia bacterium]|nr:VOC family protein [Dehalococcoidia bacterium]
MSGRVVHFEVPYDDGARARAFYSKAFGWQLMEIPDMGYTRVTSGPSGDQGPTEPGFINGGMMQRQAPFTAPNLVIDVPNLEEALRAVNEAGGATVSERQPVGDMGFTAYFRDTEGNLVGLWESAPRG